MIRVHDSLFIEWSAYDTCNVGLMSGQDVGGYSQLCRYEADGKTSLGVCTWCLCYTRTGSQGPKRAIG